MNVVMTGGGQFVEIQATGEGRTFSSEEMQRLLGMAASGISQLRTQQQALLQLNFSGRER
jgi:ribonuclease PH